MDAPPTANRIDVPLHRRVARITPDRIDIRPSRGAILAPLSGLLVGVLSSVLIWVGMAWLPLWLLAILLIVAVLAIPFAGLGTIYALIGAHVVVDRQKGSATWQQGFLGMGVGTTELVPFAKIAQWRVEESGSTPEESSRPVEEFAQWRILLEKVSGKRLDIGMVTVPRSLADQGFARACQVAAALAELTSSPVAVPDRIVAPAHRPRASYKRMRGRAQGRRRR